MKAKEIQNFAEKLTRFEAIYMAGYLKGYHSLGDEKK